jgi:formate-dependent nitrite reductase membrane component NrfD
MSWLPLICLFAGVFMGIALMSVLAVARDNEQYHITHTEWNDVINRRN